MTSVSGVRLGRFLSRSRFETSHPCTDEHGHVIGLPPPDPLRRAYVAPSSSFTRWRETARTVIAHRAELPPRDRSYLSLSSLAPSLSSGRRSDVDLWTI